MKNYYEILEVNSKASKEVIEKAYKVLVRKYHPDLYEGIQKIEAGQKIREINEAYDILSNGFLREQYDLERMKEEELRKENLRASQEGVTSFLKRKKQNKGETNINETGQEEQETEKINKKMEKYQVGTFSGILTLLKELYSNRNQIERKSLKDITQKDVLAVILTIIVVIAIGIALWFIPFTNGWMRQLLFENPIFNWIGGIFI